MGRTNPSREGVGVGDCRDAAVENENVTNEPEREGDLDDAEGFAPVENENGTNEPEREGVGVGALGFAVVENENLTNEPERGGDGVADCLDSAAVKENATNEPEMMLSPAGVGATQAVSDALTDAGEVFFGAIDVGIAAFRCDLARPGEIVEGLDLRGPPVSG